MRTLMRSQGLQRDVHRKRRRHSSMHIIRSRPLLMSSSSLTRIYLIMCCRRIWLRPRYSSTWRKGSWRGNLGCSSEAHSLNRNSSLQMTIRWPRKPSSSKMRSLNWSSGRNSSHLSRRVLCSSSLRTRIPRRKRNASSGTSLSRNRSTSSAISSRTRTLRLLF
jgi:hypothetical protein